MNINEFTNHQFMYKLPSNKLYKLKSPPREINTIPAILEISYQIPFQNEILRNNNSLINSYKESKEQLNFNIFENTFFQKNLNLSSFKKEDIKNPFRKILEEKLKKSEFNEKRKRKKLKLKIEEQKNNSLSRNKTNINYTDNKISTNSNNINYDFNELYKSLNQKHLLRKKIIYCDNIKDINLIDLKMNENYINISSEKEEEETIFIIHSIKNKKNL